MNRSHKLTFIIVVLFAAALWQLGLAGWIHTKAVAAQILLDNAWQKTLIDKQAHRPWPWADTWPVAELIIPGHDIAQIVLQGDAGASLAFGPGQSTGSAKHGERGVILISGHRDTHFSFLQDIQLGDRIILKTRIGIHYYRVSDTKIVDSTNFKVDRTVDGLVLSTCYPFNTALFGGSERYLVYAEREYTT